MKFTVAFIISILFTISSFKAVHAQQFTKSVKPFEKVIVSPHISVTFEKGDREEVIIEDIDVSKDKLKFEEKGGTLHIYLEGAKTITKNETEKGEGYKVKKPIYTGTEVHARIIYKSIKDLSLRGEERFVFKGKIRENKLKLTVYGESNIRFDEVEIQQMSLTLYGESVIRLKSGKVDRMKITAYGESEVMAANAQVNELKVIAYGGAEVKSWVTHQLKITAYGEAEIRYKGNPHVDKGIVIGHAVIEKFD